MPTTPLLSLSDTPYPFRLLPAVRYGTASATDFATGPAQEAVPLYLDLLLPETPDAGPRPLAIYLHGGGWRSGERSTAMYPWVGPLLASHGFVAASVTYRLSTDAPFPAQIHDVKAAVRFLRAHAADHGIDPDRIGVWGDSAGGHLSALLALTSDVAELDGPCGTPGVSSDVQAVVPRCAPSDFARFLADRHDDVVFRQLFGGDAAERPDLVRLASPVTHVHRGAPPFLLVHGTADEIVPFEQSEILAAALRANDVDATLHPVEGGHHNMLSDVSRPWGDQPWTELGHLALEFFTKHLAG